jgi:hypothetical protein
VRHFRAKVALTGVLILTVLEACMHWSTKSLDPERFTAQDGPDRVRVTLEDGRQLSLQHPFISGDSLVWRQPGPDPADTLRGERKGILLSQIKKVEVHELDAVATAALVAGIGVTIAIVAAEAKQTGSSGGGGTSNGCACGDCNTDCASCPFVYSWNGAGWQLESGTFGGAIARPLARTEVDNLGSVRPLGGVLRLKLTNELDETDYVDALSVLAVDHDSGVSVAADGAGRPHSLGPLTGPERARDFRGHDVLARVRAADGWNWESSPAGRDPAIAADLRDGIELTFLRPAGASAARLVVDGNNTRWAEAMMRAFVGAHGRATQAWYDSLDAFPERTRKLFAMLAQQAFLSVAILIGGHWEQQGLLTEASPEIVKRRVLPLDLSRVTGDTVRIRLESVPSFWLIDRVALDFSPERPLAVTELSATTAVDSRGRDVREPLAAADGHFLTVEPGDYAELRFQAPMVPPGSRRTYLVRATGWYRIHPRELGEPDVAFLQRVLTEPLAVSRISIARMNAALRKMELVAH